MENLSAVAKSMTVTRSDYVATRITGRHSWKCGLTLLMGVVDQLTWDMQTYTRSNDAEPEQQIVLCGYICVLIDCEEGLMGIARMHEKGWQIRDGMMLHTSAKSLHRIG